MRALHHLILVIAATDCPSWGSLMKQGPAISFAPYTNLFRSGRLAKMRPADADLLVPGGTPGASADNRWK
jgi:hypothetical protein